MRCAPPERSLEALGCIRCNPLGGETARQHDCPAAAHPELTDVNPGDRLKVARLDTRRLQCLAAKRPDYNRQVGHESTGRSRTQLSADRPQLGC
jgi:hypothetical protein